MFPPALVPAIDEAFGDLLAEARAGLSLEAVVAQERAMTAWHAEDQLPMNAEVGLPVLVLVGTEDVVIPPGNGDLLAARWSPCEIERFVDGGHAFFALEPQRTADRITSFLLG